MAQTIRYRAGDALPESLEAAVELLSAASKLKHDDPGQAADWLSLVPHLRALLSSDARLPAEAEASLATRPPTILGADSGADPMWLRSTWPNPA